MKISAEEIKTVIDLHRKWLHNEDGGQRANLQGAYLQDANLRGANLQDANLYGANLQDAYLRGAYLYGANLQGAYLQDAYLYGANLRGANLQGANLRGAKINWRSHALISEILRRAADDNVQKRMIAGLIAISLDWCWREFLNVESHLREWALDELAKWVTEGDDAPEILRERLPVAEEARQ